MLTIRITNLDKLQRKMDKAPANLLYFMEQAMGKAIEMTEGNIKRRTPVKTSNLRTSIGGAGGYKYIKPLKAEVGTNVKYAAAVNYIKARHTTGDRLFMERGLKASEPFIEKVLDKAMKKLAKDITS